MLPSSMQSLMVVFDPDVLAPIMEDWILGQR